MSVLTAKPITVTPTSSAGTAITSGGSAWASGSWVQFVSSAAAASVLVGVWADSNLSAGRAYEIDVGVGGAGSEVVIATIRSVAPNSGNGGERNILLTIPIDAIPNASRVALRLRTSVSSGEVMTVVLYYSQTFDSDHVTTVLLKSAPSAAASASVTPNGTAWNSSAWSELSTGLGTDGALAWLAILGAVDVEFEVDLGTGTAGAEVVVTTLRGSYHGSGGVSNYRLTAVRPISSNVRVAYRLRKSGTSTTAWSAALAYYDGLHIPAVGPFYHVIPGHVLSRKRPGQRVLPQQ